MKIRFTFVGTEYKPITIDTANEKSNFFIGKSFPNMLGGIMNDKILVMALESQMNAEPQPASPFVNPRLAPLQNCQSQQLGYHGYAYNYTCPDPLTFVPTDLIVNDVNSPKFFTKIPEGLMPFIQFLIDEHQSHTIKVEVLNKNGATIFTDNIVNYGYRYIMPDTVTLEDVLVQAIKTKITNGDFCLK